MNHTLYGLITGFRYRNQLATILHASAHGVHTDTVTPELLKKQGIRVLALDFDGVLAPHGRNEPLPETARWLKACCSCFGEQNIYILSNKPTPARSDWFTCHFPGIRFISGVRKKPYPDGLLQIIEQSGAQPREVMLLDDRLLTGVLATCLADTSIIFIDRPYIDFRGNPVPELIFAALRAIERTLLGVIAEKDPERRNR
jgi:predicted HAD superfamily phosphohydrolase YqeG